MAASGLMLRAPSRSEWPLAPFTALSSACVSHKCTWPSSVAVTRCLDARCHVSAETQESMPSITCKQEPESIDHARTVKSFEPEKAMRRDCESSSDSTPSVWPARATKPLMDRDGSWSRTSHAWSYEVPRMVGVMNRPIPLNGRDYYERDYIRVDE